MMGDPLNPAQRLRRTLRQLQGVQLGPHGHGDVNQLRTGSVAGPYGTFGPGSLLPGGDNSVQTAALTPQSIQAASQLRDLAMQRQATTDPAKQGVITGEIQQAVGSLSQLLRPRRRSRGGHQQASSAGGKPAATVGGRPYLP
jgi:hypothetical protein